jgi:hypothetical protein
MNPRIPPVSSWELFNRDENMGKKATTLTLSKTELTNVSKKIAMKSRL